MSPSYHILLHISSKSIFRVNIPNYMIKNGLIQCTLNRRCFATAPHGIHLPPPPPREFNEDGTPKKYRNSRPIYNHKYNWEHWTLRPAGVFHTVLVGEFGRQHKRFAAWLLQYPAHISFIPLFIVIFGLAFLIQNIIYIGVRPKRYTVEWVKASQERDRAENTNPVTRYLDRRRSERGPNWVLKDYMPRHPHFAHLGNYYHDPDMDRVEPEEIE